MAANFALPVVAMEEFAISAPPVTQTEKNHSKQKKLNRQLTDAFPRERTTQFCYPTPLFDSDALSNTDQLPLSYD